MYITERRKRAETYAREGRERKGEQITLLCKESGGREMRSSSSRVVPDRLGLEDVDVDAVGRIVESAVKRLG